MKNDAEGFFVLTHFLRTWYFFENIIYSFLDPSRENNKYAKNLYELQDPAIVDSLSFILRELIYRDSKTDAYSLSDIKKYFGIDSKYVAINLDNIRSREYSPDTPIHIEIRSHEGTTNISDIYNWIIFVNLILSTCINEIHEVFQYLEPGPNRNTRRASDLLWSYMGTETGMRRRISNTIVWDRIPRPIPQLISILMNTEEKDMILLMQKCLIYYSIDS